MTRSTLRSGYSAARRSADTMPVASNPAAAAPCVMFMAVLPTFRCRGRRGLFDVALARMVRSLRRAPDQRSRLAVPNLRSLRTILVPPGGVGITELLVQPLGHLGGGFDQLVRPDAGISGKGV